MHLILLSGERASGKTSACLRLIELAHERHMECAGILAPGMLSPDGARTAISLLNVTTGERRYLTDVADGEESLAVGPFRFSARMMDWAVARACAALRNKHDLVVLDEIGPLELRQGAGFAPALALLETSNARACVLVVRSSLTQELAERLSALNPTVMRLNLANREDVPGQVLALALASADD